MKSHILPGFALTDFLGADTVDFSGSQSIIVKTGGAFFGDYFFVNFTDSFVANQFVDETVYASWNTNVFDPDAVEELDVRWGATSIFAVGDGILLTSVAVPEPSAALLLGAAFLGGVFRRRRA